MTNDIEIEFNKYHSKLRNDSKIKKCVISDISGTETCSGEIVKAHSIQKGKILSSIAESGEVISIQKVEISKNNIQMVFSKVGINKFSTFTGFCQKHDKEIFKKIEDSDFIKSDEQMLIYAFRCVAKEYLTKQESFNMNLKLNNGIRESRTDNLYFDIQELKAFLQFMSKNIMENGSHKYNCLTHYCYTLNENYPIVCNSVFNLHIDDNYCPIFSKNELSKIEEKPQNISHTPLIMLNIFPENGKTYILVSHSLGMKNKFSFLKKLFKSNKKVITQYFSNILISNCENIAFSPSYILNSFSENERKSILQYYNNNIIFRAYDKNFPVNLFRKSSN